MKETELTAKTAELAKEKGATCTTQHHLQQWLREEQSIYVSIIPWYDSDETGDVLWDGYITVTKAHVDGDYLENLRGTYEEVLEIVLQQALLFIE